MAAIKQKAARKSFSYINPYDYSRLLRTYVFQIRRTSKFAAKYGKYLNVSN